LGDWKKAQFGPSIQVPGIVRQTRLVHGQFEGGLEKFSEERLNRESRRILGWNRAPDWVPVTRARVGFFPILAPRQESRVLGPFGGRGSTKGGLKGRFEEWGGAPLFKKGGGFPGRGQQNFLGRAPLFFEKGRSRESIWAPTH